MKEAKFCGALMILLIFCYFFCNVKCPALSRGIIGCGQRRGQKHYVPLTDNTHASKYLQKSSIKETVINTVGFYFSFMQISHQLLISDIDFFLNYFCYQG